MCLENGGVLEIALPGRGSNDLLGWRNGKHTVLRFVVWIGR